MNVSDIYNLDGNILRTFLIILEESSVSKAAVRLNVTQSAVSYALARLRSALRDPNPIYRTPGSRPRPEHLVKTRCRIGSARGSFPGSWRW